MTIKKSTTHPIAAPCHEIAWSKLNWWCSVVPAQVIVGNFLQTFQDYPPRQKPGSFSRDRVLEKLQQGQPK